MINEENKTDIEGVESSSSSVENNNESPTPNKVGAPKKVMAIIIAAISVLVVAVIILLALVLGGCTPNNDQNGDGAGADEIIYQDYSVTVTDGLGNPVSNVIVRYINGSGEEKMRVTGEDGVAAYKNAVAADYRVIIEQGYSDAIILQNEYQLTKDVTSAKVIVRNFENTVDIYGAVADDSFAYFVSEGTYDVICNGEGYYYVVFSAFVDGIYKFSFNSDDSNMTIGYYGMPMVVQAQHCGDGPYDGKSFELTVKEASTSYVIGLKASKEGVAELKIERIADAPFDPDYDAEWEEIPAVTPMTQCDLSGKIVKELDISSDELSVYLADDGFYYTSDGKPVYIRITSITGHMRLEGVDYVPVLGGSLALIAGYTDPNVGNNVGGYVYDEDGNFVGKHRYNEMIEEYMEYADAEHGVVPLTAEFAQGIKLHGDFHGWWNPNSGSYLFSGLDVNLDNAWLFLCVTAE